MRDASYDKSQGRRHSSANTSSRAVLASFLARLTLTATGVAVFLVALAAVGLVVELLAGVGALALAAGVFVVALMVAARAEGLI